VVIARDGVPDSTPFAPPSTAVVDLQSASGNVVVIDMGDDRFASYAHLANGSLMVTAGDEVAEGQAVGLIGNSGNSLGPHLHFQMSDAAEILSGEGLPFLLREFELVGRVSTLGRCWRARRGRRRTRGGLGRCAPSCRWRTWWCGFARGRQDGGARVV
jgi:murein DD-endopeptidase MepM/ murein hydrolase activator NlpD